MRSHRLRRAVASAVIVMLLTLGTASRAPAATDLTQASESGSGPIQILSPSPFTSVRFEDLDAAAATSVDFTWLFVDANGAVIAEAETSAHGRFAPNVPAEGSAPAAERTSGYASGNSLYLGDEVSHIYVPIQHVIVAVDNATFSDGTAWHADTRQSNAAPPLLAADESVGDAHLRITRIQSERSADRYDAVDARFSFANEGKKHIDAVQFTYTFYGLDGSVLYTQPALVRGAYAHGAVSTLNPSTRVSVRGVVMNGGSVWLGWGSRAQYVASIVVGVDAIRYSDGTIWTKDG